MPRFFPEGNKVHSLESEGEIDPQTTTDELLSSIWRGGTKAARAREPTEVTAASDGHGI